MQTASIKTFLSLLLFLFCSVNQPANAQVYTIQSFDGIKTPIKISNKNATIYSPHDSLKLAFYNSLQAVKVIHNHFLQITYVVKAGVDINQVNLLLLSVNKGKLYQATHIVSFFKSSLKAIDTDTDTLLFNEHQFLQLKYYLTGTNKSNYKLYVNIHNEEKSKADPKKITISILL